MSVQAIGWALKQKLPTATKFVLVALCNYADQDGACWPSQNTLAADTSMTNRTVRTHLKKLEELGVIDRRHRQRGDGTRNSDLYVINRNLFPHGEIQPETDDNPTGNSRQPTGNSLPIQPERDSGKPSIEPSIEPSLEPLTAFEQFWLDWIPYDMPKGLKQRGNGKKNGAVESWEKEVLKPGVDQEMVRKQARSYCSQCRAYSSKTMHAATWLNSHGWKNDYTPAPNVDDAIDEMIRRKDEEDAGEQSADQGTGYRSIGGKRAALPVPQG